MIIIIILELLLVFAMVALMNVTSVEKRFIRAIRQGVITGWSREINEMAFSDTEGGHDLAFIKDEYESVKSFKGMRFRKEALGELADEYISALEECLAVSEENDPAKDYDTFWSRFSQSYGRRVNAIYSIYRGNYGLSFSDEEQNKYAEEIDNILVKGWSLQKTGSIVFHRMHSDSESGTDDNEDSGEEYYYTATVSNDSGYDLKYIDVTVELYDSNGDLIEEISAYAENIKNGEDFELTCYQMVDAEAKSYLISAVECQHEPVKEAPPDTK